VTKRRLPVIGAKKEPLTAERLFSEHFLPLYPPGANLQALRASDANPASNPAILAAIEETARVFAALAPEALERSDLELDLSDASIHRLSAALTASACDRLFERRVSPGGPPLLVPFVIHAALYVGACAVKNHAGKWLVRSPLWETRVELESIAGRADIAPFSWLLRSLADEGALQDGTSVTLADRYRTFVEVPCEDVFAWPILAEPERRIPRLSRPRYDVLFRHLKRHLPELDELGTHFPSPQRFTELGFRWLDFKLVGGGRALLAYGPATRGAHLFWLTRSGFTKAAYFENDDGADPRLVDRSSRDDADDRIEVALMVAGKRVAHEMLWWGP